MSSLPFYQYLKLEVLSHRHRARILVQVDGFLGFKPAAVISSHISVIIYSNYTDDFNIPVQLRNNETTELPNLFDRHRNTIYDRTHSHFQMTRLRHEVNIYICLFYSGWRNFPNQLSNGARGPPHRVPSLNCMSSRLMV